MSVGKYKFENSEKTFSLETRRIEQFLDNTIEKLKFALTIPVILTNDIEFVKTQLSDLEMEMVEKALCKYANKDTKHWSFKNAEQRMDFLSIHNSRGLENFFNEYKPKDETLPKSEEYAISKAIQILYEKDEIRELSTTYHTLISDGGGTFIDQLNYLFEVSLEEMKTTPTEAIKKEEELRKIFNHFSELSDYDSFAQESKENQFNKDISYFDRMIKDIRKWEKSIDELEEEAADYIESIQKETDEILLKELKNEEERQTAMLAEIEAGIMDIESLRKKHIDQEREVRIRRYKTEQQFVTVLQVYDRDLIERQQIYNDIKGTLEEERALRQEFQVKYDEQTKVYNRLMEEKKALEEKMVKGRLYEIKCNIAARKIQRCYKRYRAAVAMENSLMQMESRKSKKDKRKTKS